MKTALKIVFTCKKVAVEVGVVIGSLSNDDGGDVNENSKKLDWQNNKFARASRFVVRFFVVTARL